MQEIDYPGGRWVNIYELCPALRDTMSSFLDIVTVRTENLVGLLVFRTCIRCRWCRSHPLSTNAAAACHLSQQFLLLPYLSIPHSASVEWHRTTPTASATPRATWTAPATPARRAAGETRSACTSSRIPPRGTRAASWTAVAIVCSPANSSRMNLL